MADQAPAEIATTDTFSSPRPSSSSANASAFTRRDWPAAACSSASSRTAREQLIESHARRRASSSPVPDQILRRAPCTTRITGPSPILPYSIVPSGVYERLAAGSNSPAHTLHVAGKEQINDGECEKDNGKSDQWHRVPSVAAGSLSRPFRPLIIATIPCDSIERKLRLAGAN